MEWLQQLRFHDRTRHSLMTSSEMDSHHPCRLSLSPIHLKKHMFTQLWQTRPVEPSSLRNEGKSEAEPSCPNTLAGEVGILKFNDSKSWNSAGRSKELDHALSGFADSNPFH